MISTMHTTIREEELKNRVASACFGKFDWCRIVGDIDFCVSPKRCSVLNLVLATTPK